MCLQPCQRVDLAPQMPVSAGSTQGIGFGMLKALAGAGADVVMHGLVSQEELHQKTTALKKEYGVKVGHSAANVRKPQEIRYACSSCHNLWHGFMLPAAHSNLMVGFATTRHLLQGYDQTCSG